ncbi:hypothetical protein SEA_GEAZY_60 [Gordonia phage GEazy]|nr:hypothetical protein SEA_GEAZY_60 [Gordonia phage GEazy]QDF16769.1 hypothetical protein SEA_HANNAHD_57 [Gordonia phage HannahD]
MSETPRIPSGQPTWTRVRHGGGCALPRRLEDGTIGILPTTVPVRLVLDRYETAPSGSRREVWVLLAESWSEGDSVEIGPLPANARVEYEIARPFVRPFPAAATDVEVLA